MAVRMVPLLMIEKGLLPRYELLKCATEPPWPQSLDTCITYLICAKKKLLELRHGLRWQHNSFTALLDGVANRLLSILAG